MIGQDDRTLQRGYMAHAAYWDADRILYVASSLCSMWSLRKSAMRERDCLIMTSLSSGILYFFVF